MADNSMERNLDAESNMGIKQISKKQGIRQEPEIDESQTLSVRQYLDQSVAPLLIQAMSEVAKERPEKPIEYIIKYLRNNNPNTGSPV